MIATDSPCPTPDQLRNLAAGKLPGDRFTRLLEHLEMCSECQERAQSLDPSDDSLIAVLASPKTSDPHAAEADCIAALHSSSQQKRSPSLPSTPPVEQLGPYRLIRPLGSGGMGAVFLAHHTRLRRQCAIKLLPRDRGFDTAWRQRFDREMAAVAALNDPHVVAASDAGEADGWHFLVMEYLDGLDLSRLAGRMGRLPVADACELVRQAAVGLAHVHSAGLVHRDVKPSNLMLTRDGVVKILDLGLVLSDRDPLPDDDRLTTVGQLMGTLAYMAPEQLADSTAVDHRADLYALGATLYRLLAGTPPHGAARGIAPLVLAKTRGPAPDLSATRSDLPKPVIELVRSLLDREPSNRPSSAAAVAESLQPHTVGADPKHLLATAQRKRPNAEEATSRSLAPLAAINVGPTRPPRRPRNWKAILAAAALPLLVLAGVTLVIVTDRGQLVIESEASGLNVSIEQGDELIEQLQLSTGENRITLRSGTYTVTMDAEADGLQLSDQRATVTRGDKTVLRVRREPLAVESSILSADVGPRYRGETFGHWLSVLETERDVETVIDAMQAVIALSKEDRTIDGEASTADESQQAEAAAAMLRAARRYGGMSYANPGMETFGAGQHSSSSRFMGHLLTLYPALLPSPGIDEISRELAEGNEQSSMAAIYLLYNYARETIIAELHRPEFGAFEQWSKTEEGRERLRGLADHVDRAAERLGGYALPVPEDAGWSSDARPASLAVSLAYQIRLRLNELLDVNSFEDPVIADRLRRSIENAEKHARQLFKQIEQPQDLSTPSSQPSSLSDEEVRAAVDEMEANVVAWAVVPSLLQSYFSNPEMPLDLLRRLGEEAPNATADAALAIFHNRGLALSSFGTSGFIGGVGGGSTRPGMPVHAHNAPLIAKAVELIGQSTTKPEPARRVLQKTREQFETTPQELAGFSDLTDAMESAIEALK